MVTRCDAISSRWSSHFWVKIHVFSTFLGMKVNFVEKVMQSNYLCVILHDKRKKLLILIVFTWFLILDKIQDGDHVWWRHRPPATPPPIKYTSSCREDQRLSTEGKIVLKFCDISKTQGRKVPSTPPPPPSWSAVGVWRCVYVQGLNGRIKTEKQKKSRINQPCPLIITFHWQSKRWVFLCTVFTNEAQESLHIDWEPPG